MSAAPNLSELDRLRAYIAELEAELKEWRGQYGQLEERADLQDADERGDQMLAMRRICCAFRLKLAPARVLAFMVARRGRPCPSDQLEAVAQMNAEVLSPRKLLGVYICWIRQALGPAAVETIWGFGYAVSADAAAAIEAKLAAAPDPRFHVPTGREGRPRRRAHG